MQTGQLVLAIGLTLLACGLVWFGMWWRQRNQSTNARALFGVVLVAGLVVRLAYVFLTPIFYAPDEQSHFNYIKHLAEKNRSLFKPANSATSRTIGKTINRRSTTSPLRRSLSRYKPRSTI